jgi:excisionase family DNA binding protein
MNETVDGENPINTAQLAVKANVPKRTIRTRRLKKKTEQRHLEGGWTVPLRTKQQAADYIQCTPRFLERMVRGGRLRALKPTGKLVRFRQTDLDAFLESGATTTGGGQ